MFSRILGGRKRHSAGFLAPIREDGTAVFCLGSVVRVRYAPAMRHRAHERVTLHVVQFSNSVVGTRAVPPVYGEADCGCDMRFDAARAEYRFDLGTAGLARGTFNLCVRHAQSGRSRSVLISLK